MSRSPSLPRAVSAASQVEASANACAVDLYERFQVPVYRYCRSQLRSCQEAEDALQSTFLRAFTALRNGVVPEFEVAWLYRIAHNVCVSRRLATTRQARLEIGHDLRELEHMLPASEHEQPEELERLDDALSELPENLRRAILLREWQGLSYAEIAEALGASIPAVETLIFRARRALTDALRPAAPALEAPLAA